MASTTAAQGPQAAPAPSSNPSTPTDPHEAAVENREAYEYWGYLFKPDKTGTDRLKALLRGLKAVVNKEYETSDQPDLTPNQLAHFYRDLQGNYDQLFLGTPHESIAFIYKSLGCLHSLQPTHHTHATAFTDPTVPALKTEGWIMWQTIQVLLGPEEHSNFLREAVERWDVKDPETGEIFPKILPRECFPREPDRHMVAWYEGVSERLRREAEEEEKQKQVEVAYEHHQPVPGQRRIHGRLQPPTRRDPDGGNTDDEGSVDSRGPALAYFRNPLYRHVDGRPSIVRQNSKRPGLSPRQTMMNKGKEAASTFTRIAKSVGSPHLWDGGRSESRSGSHDARRRRSHPENPRHHRHGTSTSPSDGAVLEPSATRGSHDSHHQHRRDLSSHKSGSSLHHHRRRTGSSNVDRPTSSSTAADDEWWEDGSDKSPDYSPSVATAGTAIPARHLSHARSSASAARPRAADMATPLRQSRSAEPTPSAAYNEPGDYFAGYNVPPKTAPADSPTERRDSSPDHSRQDEDTSPDHPPAQQHRRGSTPPPMPANNGVGVSFGPSAGPLFASTVAKIPAFHGGSPRSGSGQGGGRGPLPPMGMGFAPSMAGGPEGPRMSHHRHSQSLGPRDGPGRARFDDLPPSGSREGSRHRFEDGRGRFDDERRDGPRMSEHRHRHGHEHRARDGHRHRDSHRDRDRHHAHSPRHNDEEPRRDSRRRSGESASQRRSRRYESPVRHDGDEFSPQQEYFSGEDEFDGRRRDDRPDDAGGRDGRGMGGGGRQARFEGVKGRRYPEGGMPWGR